MAARTADNPLFAILVQPRAGRVVCTLQAVRYPGGAFAATPNQPPDLLATASLEYTASGISATCSHPVEDGWNSFTITAPDLTEAMLQALLDLIAHSPGTAAVSEAPVYVVYYPAFDTHEDGTQTRTISLRLVGHRRRVTLLGHVDETYPGVEGRHVEVYRYRRGNPKRATRIRFPDPGTDSLLLAAHALDHLARAHHPRPRLLARVLRRTCRD